MKLIALSFLFATSLSFGTDVGQSYQIVIGERGQPTSQMQAGATRMLKYDDVTIRLKNDIVVSITPVDRPAPVTTPAPSSESAPATGTSDPDATPVRPAPITLSGTIKPGSATPLHLQLASLRRTRKDAELKVQQIVNQPPKQVDRAPRMKIKTVGAGWFHEGAAVPDFNRVDVRTTQELKYDPTSLVSSDLNPGVAFPGGEIEFNPMLKYLYADRTLPKKRLTEPEMLEINRLYRTIGQIDQQLKTLSAAPQAVATR